jgi:hypothetical protein
MAWQNPPEILGPDGKPMTLAERGYGSLALPVPFQYAAVITGADKTFWMDRYDEALRDSRADAIAMCRDPYLMSLLYERMRAIACRKWHIEVEDEQDPEQLEVRDVVTKSLRRTGVGTQRECQGLIYLKFALLRAIWYGRYGMQVRWRWDNVSVNQAAPNPVTDPTALDHFVGQNPDTPAGPDIRPKTTRRALCIAEHWPVQGDKIGHTWDHTPFVMINGSKTTELPGAEILNSTLGFALALKGTWRERFIIHNYHGDDVDFFEQIDQQEAIHGLGERSTLYWLNFQRLEYDSWRATFFERVGLGTNVWLYQGGNANALNEAKAAAQDHSNKNNIFVPVWPGMGREIVGAFERVEVPTAGAEALNNMIEAIEKKMERLIVGQSDSSRREPGGFGGHDDAFQRDTKSDITIMDGEMFDATMTRDAVNTIVRYSFWDKPHLWHCARYVTEVQAIDPEKTLKAVESAAGVGVDFIKDQVRGLVPGMSKPEPGDETVGGKEFMESQRPTPPFGGMNGQGGEGAEDEGGGPPNGNGQTPGGNGASKTNGVHFSRQDGTVNGHSHSAADVLKLISASPQFAGQDVDWEKYAHRYGVEGEFVDKKMSAEQLRKLLDDGVLHTEPRLNRRAVQTKARLRDYNPVIITNRPEGGLIVCDGNHSLAAALENNEPEIACIVPAASASPLALIRTDDRLSFESQHAPVGGVKIGGKFFEGGEFIPGEVIAKASAEERAKLKKQANHSPSSVRQKFMGQAVGAAEHAHADQISHAVAEWIGGTVEEDTSGPGQKDKRPFDVRKKKRGSAGYHDIEVKSLLKGGKTSLSVHADSLLRKVEHIAANPANDFHTVAVDERATYGEGAYADSYSGHRLYYKRGSGRYSLSQMYPVRSESELTRLLNMPSDQLPEKASGQLPPPPPVDKLREKAAKASESRKARDKARKERNKDVLRAQARARAAALKAVGAA